VYLYILFANVVSIFHVVCVNAVSRDKTIFVATQHGGHLGFFEGGLVYPNAVTWLDRVVVQYTNALVSTLAAVATVEAAGNKKFY
jgi:predicted alpha/beta-fold hydrolase